MADFVKLNGYDVKDNVARPKIINLEIVNVKDYGAKGNGIADDTTAIQNALNDGVGKMVYIPSGVYNVSDTLIFKSNTYIKGCNKFDTIIKMTEDKDILKSEYYDEVTGTNPNDDICRNFILEGFCLDGGYILNYDTMAKSSKNRGNGLLIYGNKYEIRDLRVINNPRTGVKLEFTNNWTINNEKEKFEENLIFNTMIAFNGADGLVANKVNDSSFIKCSIHTNGQSNTKASENYSNMSMANSSFKMNNCHVSSLYGNIKPNSSLFLDSSCGVCNISDCHIEGAYHPLVIYNESNVIENCMIYGSFGDCNILLNGKYNRIVNCICTGQVADATHTYPEWAGAVRFSGSGGGRNTISLTLIGTRFANNFDNAGYLNDFELTGWCRSGDDFIPQSIQVQATYERAVWKVLGDFTTPSYIKPTYGV